MSCIITYKGNQYSEQEFKNYFNNNTSEFIKKVATNKSVINSFKNRIDAINFVFQQAPELENIGTKIQYLQYLSTIFPNSKVKDIVYHGTGEFNAKEILRYGFDKSLQGENKVIFFTVDKKDSFGSLGGIVSAIVNIEKLFNNRFSSLLDRDENSDSFYFPTEEDVNSAIYSSVAKRNPGNIFKDRNGNISEVSVLEPEQIHILTSKADIQGFKDFMAFKKSEFSKHGTYQQSREFNAIELDINGEPKYTPREKVFTNTSPVRNELKEVINQLEKNKSFTNDDYNCS